MIYKSGVRLQVENISLALRLALCLVLGLTTILPVSAQDSDGVALYKQGLLDEAVVELENQLDASPGNTDLKRYLALAYVDTRVYASALQTFNALVPLPENDHELRLAYAETLLVMGDPEQAKNHIDTTRVDANVLEEVVMAARIESALGEYEAAIGLLEDSRATDDQPHTERDFTLARLLVRGNQSQAARELIQQNIDHGDSSFVFRELESILDTIPKPEKAWDVTIGYRFEYDSNPQLAPQESTAFLEEESDVRHTALADFRWQKDLRAGWDLYSEAHLAYRNLDDLGHLNQNWQHYVVSPGWNGQRFGFRLPAGYRRSEFDNERFSRRYDFSPGVVVRVTNDLFSYSIIRYSNFDYDIQVDDPAENFSGDQVMLSNSIYWGFSDSAHARAGVDIGQFQAEGDNWDRDQYRIYGVLNYQVTDQIRTVFSLEYLDFDFDNVHSVFDIRRRNEHWNAGFSISYTTGNNIEYQFRTTHRDSDSNIPLYDYNRTQYSVGVAKHF